MRNSTDLQMDLVKIRFPFSTRFNLLHLVNYLFETTILINKNELAQRVFYFYYFVGFCDANTIYRGILHHEGVTRK